MARRGESRQRVLEAAQELFAEHGVSGTSLQAIADALGVTKAAVYHQFSTKEEIVLAVVTPALDELRLAIDAAEALPTAKARRSALLSALVSLAIDHSDVSAVLRNDPVVTRTLEDHPPQRSVAERLESMLLGPTPTVQQRVAATVAVLGVMQARHDPRLRDLDDTALRAALLAFLQGVL